MITIQTQLISSKNSKQILKHGDKRFIGKSFKAMSHQKELMQLLALYTNKFKSMIQDKEKPYKISFKIYRQSKHRFDYTNIIQLLCDCMVKCGWLDDDHADNLILVFVPYEVDKDNPRVIISVL